MSLGSKGKVRAIAAAVAVSAQDYGWKLHMESGLPAIPAEALGTWGWPMAFRQLIKGDYMVNSRDFPHLIAHGCNLQEARENAKQALEDELTHCMNEELQFPPPSKDLLEHEELVFMSALQEELLYGYLNTSTVE